MSYVKFNFRPDSQQRSRWLTTFLTVHNTIVFSALVALEVDVNAGVRGRAPSTRITRNTFKIKKPRLDTLTRVIVKRDMSCVPEQAWQDVLTLHCLGSFGHTCAMPSVQPTMSMSMHFCMLEHQPQSTERDMQLLQSWASSQNFSVHNIINDNVHLLFVNNGSNLKREENLTNQIPSQRLLSPSK